MSDSLKYYCGDGRVDDCGPASSDIFEKLHSLLQEKKKEEKNQSDDEQEQQETDVGCGALESGLQNILGLESGHAAHPKQVRTLQCGEFKFPDVTSPLNKILSSCGGDRFRPSLESCSSAGMSTSSFGFAGSPFNYRTSCSSGNSSDGTAAGHRNNNGVSPMHASQLDFHRISVSPDSSSDDAGYGTSYGSGYANANGAQQNQSAERSTFMADRNPAGGGDKEEGEEKELNHLLKCLRTSGELSPSLFPNPRYSSTHGNVTFGGERRPLLKNAEGFANDGFHTAFNNGFERAGPVFARGEQQQHGEARYASMQQQPYFSCSSALYATPHFESASSSSCSPHFGLPPSSSSSSVAFATPTDVAASDATMASNQATNSSLSALERAARIHRKGTALHNASCRWSGQLPCRNIAESNLSCKVFLGGVPWDITEGNLIQCFKSYGLVRVEWPGRENGAFGAGGGPEHLPRGYLYVIFEDEKQVKALLSECTQSYTNGGSWYYKISSRRMKNKEVQVIPWIISDSNHILVPMRALDSQKTVFVGALHGMLTAEALCKIFNDIFGGVVYAGVDTDKYKYPIGSGRVTFDNHKSYMKAVVAAFIEIETDKFNKKVQVDPYLEDALCSSCGLRQGPYFCREVVCFKYFCRSCWEANHTNNSLYRQHKPLMRNNKRTNMANSPFAKAAFFNRE